MEPEALDPPERGQAPQDCQWSISVWWRAGPDAWRGPDSNGERGGL